ncbi:LpqB family beta-propeller domain-containing protein [Nocardioides sp. W7]|uniref:LpqB family beta-propeller domain-containing protein n=1 Tax=Nocardioides sp. W7 TaxID=2931390 RepID=UPI001FD4F9C7|nr:LpqB family beta-propeller domain-containing protein [Nocardioides sp. W7]
MRRPSRVGAAVLTAVLLVLAAGCVGLPESGPVVETDNSRGTPETTGVKYDPLPPLPDASRSEIVKGFLDAMTAVPIQTTSAAEFLTQEARASWRPERETITYGDRSPALDISSVVRVRMLDGSNRFDARGAWRGSLSGSDLDLRFGLEMERGQWRIADVRDALIVPESWFEARFRRLSLSFFDPSAEILVPEPVFVADDDALATRLVEGLLDGPGPALAPSSRSFFPPGARLGDLSVPVSPDGVAEVSLSDVGQQPPESQRLMVVQLAATLRQVAGVTSVRVSVDGDPVQPPGSEEGRFPVGLGAQYDPAVPGASAVVFGIRERRLVSGIPEDLDPVRGLFGTGEVALRSAAVSLDGSTAAAVTTAGAVLVAPVNGDADDVRSILDRGTDLLEPAWDFADRIWLVDRRADGARVRYYENDRLRALEVPGVTGQLVRSFLVSRDGSRMVAVVAGRSGDELVVSRIRHRARGDVRNATPAQVILGGALEAPSIKDVAWRSPTSVAVLTGVAGELWEVRSVAVDGAPTSVESIANLNGPVRSLAGSPVEGQSLLVLAPDGALDLSRPVAREIELGEGRRLRSLGYVG